MVKDNRIRELVFRECQDLMQICLEIYSHTSGETDLELFERNVPEGYRDTLERIIALMKQYLELVLRFTNNSPIVIRSHVKHKSILTSALNIPSLAYSLWTRVKLLTTENVKMEIERTVDDVKRESNNQEIQTQITSLLDCENCNISKEIVRELVDKIEKLCSVNKIDSYIQIVRQQLRPRIHEMTDWSAMMYWSEAIVTDINSLTIEAGKKGGKTKKEENKQNNKLYSIIQNLEAQLGYAEPIPQVQEIEKLKIVIKQLKTKLNRKSEKFKELLAKYEDSERSCQNLTDENLELKQNLNCEKKTAEAYKSSTTEQLNEMNIKLKHYEAEKVASNRKMQTLELENESCQLLINEQFSSSQSLERKLQESRENEKILQEKLGTLKTAVDSLNSLRQENVKLQTELKERINKEKKMAEKTKKLQEDLCWVKEKFDKLLAKVKENDPSFHLDFTGEPIVDVQMQKVLNEQKIKCLRSKNKKLQCTLDKLCSNDKSASKCDNLFIDLSDNKSCIT